MHRFRDAVLGHIGRSRDVAEQFASGYAAGQPAVITANAFFFGAAKACSEDITDPPGHRWVSSGRNLTRPHNIYMI